MSIKIYKGFLVNTNAKRTGRFIDLETFIKEENDKEFVKATVIRLIPFIKIPDKVKAFAVALFMIEAQELKEDYPWIYNPPQFPNITETTQGSIERENFSKDYGGYMEMVYLCAGMSPQNWDSVFKWKTKKFLFMSEYLLRKRTIENLK